MAYFDTVRVVVQRLTRPEVVVHHNDLVAFLQHALELRLLPIATAAPLTVGTTGGRPSRTLFLNGADLVCLFVGGCVCGAVTGPTGGVQR